MDFVIDMLSVPHAVPVNPQLGFKISEEKNRNHRYSNFCMFRKLFLVKIMKG